jgi:hypothetical protein
MEIKNFVKIYDDVLPINVVSNIIRFSNKSNFLQTRVGGNINEPSRIDFNVRRTWTLPLSNLDNSLSNVHWFNYLSNAFDIKLKQYVKDLDIKHLNYQKIINVEILKYENTGFYKWHTDHFALNPRTMSCILLLNNDYVGGNLCFKNPNDTGEWEVEVKPNRMIIWPSCFMYPHTVKPVTDGIRYSVVAWAL